MMPPTIVTSLPVPVFKRSNGELYSGGWPVIFRKLTTWLMAFTSTICLGEVLKMINSLSLGLRITRLIDEYSNLISFFSPSKVDQVITIPVVSKSVAAIWPLGEVPSKYMQSGIYIGFSF